MRRRAMGSAVYRLLDTVRDGRSDAPLLVVSPLLCPIRTQTSGPTVIDLAAMGPRRDSIHGDG